MGVITAVIAPVAGLADAAQETNGRGDILIFEQCT
jgi:hypothetical protein